MTTLKLQLASIRLLAKHVGWERPLSKISVSDIEKFRADRLETGIAPTSANRELRTLKALFNQAIGRGHIEQSSNPCTPVKMIKTTPKSPTYCSPKEFREIYSNAPDILWKTFLVTMYTTGLRLQEAVNLTWQDVDFDLCQLSITEKKGQGWIQNWHPKDHEIRIIPLPEQAISLLAALQTVAPEKCPYVFMDHGRWEYYSEHIRDGQWKSGQDLVNNLLRRFKTICRKAGIGCFTLHDLRRSCMTNWAQYLPTHVVQHLAGHSDIRTTQTYYLSVRNEDIENAQKVQAKLLGKIPKSDLADPKLTHSGKKRCFPDKKAFILNA